MLDPGGVTGLALKPPTEPAGSPWSRAFFIDEQRFGPYKFWHHQHHFRQTDKGVLMTDILHYSMYGGIIGDFLNKLFIRKKIQQIFSHREEVVDKLFLNNEFVQSN